MRRAVAALALGLLTAARALAGEPRLEEPTPAILDAPAGRAATVVLVLALDGRGAVISATLLEGAGEPFDAAALAAARTLRFSTGGVGLTVSYVFAAGSANAVPQIVGAGRPEQVVVRERAPAPRPGAQPVEIIVPADEAARTAGTEGDPAKVVESLPGVARPALGSGDLVVWGAAPDQTRTYVDGIEVPALFHAGGWRSILGTSLIGSVDLVPGGYGADYGRGLGGLIRLETAPLLADGFHAMAAADALDAALAGSYGVGPDLRIGGAARASLIDLIVGSRLTSDLGGLVAVPRYRDAQLAANLVTGDDEELTALVLYSSDETSEIVPASPGVAERSDTLDAGFVRVGLRYREGAPEAPRAEIVPWVGVDTRRHSLGSAGIPAFLDDSALSAGLRATRRAPVVPGLDLEIGFDGLVTRSDLTRTGSLTVPPREGDITVFGQPPGGDVNADSWQVLELDAAAFASAAARLGPLELDGGLRLSALGVDTSRRTPRIGETPQVGSSRLELAPDPRAALAWQMSAALAITASVGQYHQLPAPEDLSAVFGTPLLGSARARHATLGARWRRGEALDVQLTGFVELDDGLAVRVLAPTPPLANVLVGTGEGRNLGAQVLVHVAVGGLVGWVAYTLARAERRSAPDAAWRLADTDQTHVGSLVVSYRLGAWTLGGRVRVASGDPRTPVVGAYVDLQSGRDDPIFGAQNTDRLPTFFSTDLRVDRRWHAGGATVDGYLEILNATAHENAEERVYSSDYRQSRLLTGLPLVGTLGVRVAY